jgi:hypothetical protein
MKTILKFLALGAIANLAVELYRRKQRWDRELRGNSAADTHADFSGDVERAQQGAQRAQPQPMENSTP